MRSASLLALVLFALLPASSSSLWARRPVHVPNVQLDVLVDGVVQPKHGAGGSFFLPVREVGCEYVLRIRNRHHRRIEAVISVDGLSVINGQKASPSIRGYLVGAGETVEIPGWRRGSSHVAAFKFSREEDSYAYKTGRPNGIGVIQLQAFEERVPRAELAKRRLAAEDAAPDHRHAASAGLGGRAAKASHFHPHPPRDRIGTAYGRELTHEVSRVPFQRSGIMHRVTIRYGRQPHPHPVHYRGGDFVPEPPGYQR